MPSLDYCTSTGGRDRQGGGGRASEKFVIVNFIIDLLVALGHTCEPHLMDMREIGFHFREIEVCIRETIQRHF